MQYVLPTSCLSSLVSCFLEHSEFTLWVRSIDYQRQLYVSDEFFDIISIERDHFYNDPIILNNFILPEDLPSFQQDITKHARTPLEVQFDSNIFRMCTKNGITPRKAIRFPIFDQSQRIVALAGLSYTLTPGNNQIQKLRKISCLSDQLQCFENQLQNILNAESKLLSCADNHKMFDPHKTYFVNGENVILTRRELQCLSETLKGYSAKVVGDKLFLAQRTVEEYLDNIRRKAKCHNKIELIAKFAPYFDV